MVGVASERLMKIAIVGGTGAFGRGLAKRLRGLGYDVHVGSRDAVRGRERAIELGVQGGSNEEVVRGAELVVLATKSSGALDTARDLAEAIGETPVLCVASDLAFTDDGVVPGHEGRSLAEEVRELLHGPVASGLQSLSAAHLAATEPPDEDAFVCGDDADAKALALELAGKVVNGRALDAGPLASARALEGMTAVIVNLNKRYKGHAGLRVTGLP